MTSLYPNAVTLLISYIVETMVTLILGSIAAAFNENPPKPQMPIIDIFSGSISSCTDK